MSVKSILDTKKTQRNLEGCVYRSYILAFYHTRCDGVCSTSCTSKNGAPTTYVFHPIYRCCLHLSSGKVAEVDVVGQGDPIGVFAGVVRARAREDLQH